MSSPSDDVSDAAELSSLLNSTHITRPRIRALLAARLQELSLVIPSPAVATTTTNPPVVLSSAPLPVSTITAPLAPSVTYTTPRYGWEQDTEYVSVLCFELPGVGIVKGDVAVTFTPRSFSLIIPNLNGRAYALRVPQLEKDIDPTLSTFKVKKNSIEIKLFKAGKWDHWAELTLKGVKIDASSKADASGGVMDMMKNMYQDGTPEMKKMIGEAMLKSQSDREHGRAGGKSLETDFDRDVGGGGGGADADFGEY
jgi:calcyclin binding protein